MKILALCGSLQRKSANLSLLHAAVIAAPEGVDVTIFEGLRDLPHFNPDLETAGDTPPSVFAWRAAIARSDALLIASPEYGHSLAGVLKNGIDWVIGSGELERKVVAITTSVPALDRGLMGLAALRQTLGAVSARIVGGEPLLRGRTLDGEVSKLLAALMDEARRPA